MDASKVFVNMDSTHGISRLRLGKAEDAGAHVHDVYDLFTEGFETGDLEEAKAFLDDQAQNPIICRWSESNRHVPKDTRF